MTAPLDPYSRRDAAAMQRRGLLDCRDSMCPSRECYHPHLFKATRSGAMQVPGPGTWRCGTREQSGCPSPIPPADRQLPDRVQRVRVAREVER